VNRSKYEWLGPLTGVAFIVVLIVSFVVAGEPKSADDPVNEIVDFYVDNKDSVEIGAILSAVAGVLLIFFGGYLRKVLRAAGGDGEYLSLISFVGLAIVAVGASIDATISFALAEAADDIDPIAVQALQALWDNDFVVFQLGVLAFIWATGISVIRSGVLPKWLGWVLIPFGIAGVTPIGFVSAMIAAIWILVVSIMLTLRARSGPAEQAPAPTV
jgi:hypothetical protein